MKTLSDIIPPWPVITPAIRRAYARRQSYHFRAMVSRRPAGSSLSLSMLRSLWLVAGSMAANGR